MAIGTILAALAAAKGVNEYISERKGRKEETRAFNRGIDTQNRLIDFIQDRDEKYDPARQESLNQLLNLIQNPNSLASDPGFQFQLDQGNKAITGAAGPRGLLGSGGTTQDLIKFNQGLAATTRGNRLAELMGLSTLQPGTPSGLPGAFNNLSQLQVDQGVARGNSFRQQGNVLSDLLNDFSTGAGYGQGGGFGGGKV